jgi:hypothetical protein
MSPFWESLILQIPHAPTNLALVFIKSVTSIIETLRHSQKASGAPHLKANKGKLFSKLEKKIDGWITAN